MGRERGHSGMEQVAPVPVFDPVTKNWKAPSFPMPPGHGRKLETKLEKKLDQLCADHFGDEFEVAVEGRNATRVFLMALEVLEGTREVPRNSNRGEMVELIQETIGRAEGEPWCMALMRTGGAYGEKKTGAVSRRQSSEGCMSVWEKSPAVMKITNIAAARPGDIAIWNYPPGWQGHTGGLREMLPTRQSMWLTEGNTTSGLNPDGLIEREGGGVYRTKRTTSSTSKMKLMGFVRPFEVIS